MNSRLFLPNEDCLEFLEIRNELLSTGTRMNAENMLALWKLVCDFPGIESSTLFLEVGNEKAGWIHIISRHTGDFARSNIASPFRALDETISNNHIEYDPDPCRPGVVSIVVDPGKSVFVFCALSTNGYVVTAFPVGVNKLKRFFESRNINLDILPEDVAGCPKEQTLNQLIIAQNPDLVATPHGPQKLDEVQIYITTSPCANLYISQIGELQCELDFHDALQDLWPNLVTHKFVNRFEEYTQDLWDTATSLDTGNRSPLEQAKYTILLLDLAYSLKMLLRHGRIPCQIFTEWMGPQLAKNTQEIYIQATGRNLRLARSILVHDLLEQFVENPELEYSQELSSSTHEANSSSPTKMAPKRLLARPMTSS